MDQNDVSCVPNTHSPKGVSSEKQPRTIFPYIPGLSVGLGGVLLAHSVKSIINIFFENHAVLSNEWIYWVSVSTTMDAFAFVFFTNLTEMRDWHNTVALGLGAFVLGALTTNVPPIPLNLAWFLCVISLLYIATCVWDAITRLSMDVISCELAKTGHIAKTRIQRGLFPDTSTWKSAATHFIIVFTVNSLLWKFTPQKVSFAVLVVGVLFEVSLSRWKFGRRTAKSDFLNVFAALIPFMEATCGKVSSLFAKGQVIEDPVAVACIGIVVGDGLGLYALYNFKKMTNRQCFCKACGSLAKLVLLCVLWPIFGVTSPVNVCRVSFVAGNGYVLLLDIVTIWFGNVLIHDDVKAE